jgi:hypothetical protein
MKSLNNLPHLLIVIYLPLIYIKKQLSINNLLNI